MTSKLTITDERLAELVAFKPLPGTDINSATRDEWMAMAAELQERRNAERGSEPVGKPFMYGIADPDGNAYIDEFCGSEDLGLVEDTVNELNYDREEGDELNYSVVALYRHAQQLGVPDEHSYTEPQKRLLLEAANVLVTRKPTVTQGYLIREVGRIAIRALGRPQPAPVVPDESYQQLSDLYHAQEKRLFKIAQRIKGPAFDKYSHSPSQAIDVLEAAIFGEDDACRAAMLQAGNSPVIPDGCVTVPKEPTERMVIDGFESEPDETFSEPEVWEAFQKMSGCEQATFRARLCWAAMLAAAPQEVK